MVELAREALHTSVTDPVAALMNFLNEVASRFPAAISLAAGRPSDEFYAVEDAERYLAVYIAHLRAQGMDEPRVRQAILQYGRTNGQLGPMIARMLETDEDIRVPGESIMVTSGCQEAMIVALRGLCASPGDVVLAAEPCYLGFSGAARVLDITLASGNEVHMSMRNCLPRCFSVVDPDVETFDFAVSGHDSGTKLINHNIDCSSFRLKQLEICYGVPLRNQ